MSNDNEQENNNKLKVISKIEVKIKPKNYEQFEGHLAKVNYVHTILDKLIKDLNEGFVPQLDSVLDKSINQLSNALAEEKSRLDKLVIKVNENYEGLIKDLKDLQSKVSILENEGTDGNEKNWEAPQFKGTDTEFMII